MTVGAAERAGAASVVSPQKSSIPVSELASSGVAALAPASKANASAPVGKVLLAPDMASAPFPSGAELGAGCFKVTTHTSVAIEICGPEQDPAWLKYANLGTAAIALLVSGIAAWVAYKTFTYAREQSRQARADSVRDEYWLRTVVSPTCIEPFQAFISSLRSSLPGPTATVPELQKYGGDAALRFNDLSLKFQSLALIDEVLASTVETALQDVEDLVSTYVSQMASHVGSATAMPDQAATVAGLTSGMVTLFQFIQDHQVKSNEGKASRWMWWRS